jgi:hypothetical protein
MVAMTIFQTSWIGIRDPVTRQNLRCRVGWVYPIDRRYCRYLLRKSDLLNVGFVFAFSSFKKVQ